MKFTIPSLLALTTLIACMIQYRRAADERARLENELLFYTLFELDAWSRQLREPNPPKSDMEKLELKVQILTDAVQAPSPTVLHGVVETRHRRLSARAESKNGFHD